MDLNKYIVVFHNLTNFINQTLRNFTQPMRMFPLKKYFYEMEGILSARNILGLCPAPTILEQNNKTKAIVLRGTQNNF